MKRKFSIIPAAPPVGHVGKHLDPTDLLKPEPPPPYGFKGRYLHFNYEVTQTPKIQFFVCTLTPVSSNVTLDLLSFFYSHIGELDYLNHNESCGFQFVDSIILKPKGKLGEFIQKYNIADKQFEKNQTYNEIVGSMTFKLASSSGTKVSVFIYNNGKIKISGGGIEIDNLQESVNNIWQTIYDQFMWDFMLYTNDGDIPTYTSPVIVNINSTYSAGEIKGNWQMKVRKIQESGLFNRVSLPTFELEGRSAAIQCYLYPERKASAVFDPNGKVHLLGFKSIAELEQAKHLVALCLI